MKTDYQEIMTKEVNVIRFIPFYHLLSFLFSIKQKQQRQL